MSNASGQYQLSVILRTIDKMSGGLKMGTSNLRAYGKEAKSVLTIQKQLNSLLSKNVPTSGVDKYMTKMRSATKETRAFATEQGKLGRRLSQPIKTTGLDAQIGKLREYRRELRGVGADSSRARVAMRGGMSSGGCAPLGPPLPPFGSRGRRPQTWGARMGDAGDFFMNMRQAGAAWRDRMDSLDKYIAPAKNLLGARTRFSLMGWSEADINKGLAGASQVSRSTRGITSIDAQEALNSLVNTIGGVDEALKFLPLAAKYQANMKVLYGEQFSQADITRQIGNTFKALELLGVDKPTGKDAQGREVFTATDQQRMERYFNIIAQATTATGGEVNPSEFRNFAKYSRMAGQDLTPEGMMKLLPLIQQMGGSSTGTAMMTLYRNMIGGVIPSYKLRNWDAMGLLDKSKVEFSGKTDKVKRLLPGAIPIAEGLGRDPMAVADKLAAKFKEFGIDTTDSDAVNKQLMSMFGDRTGVGTLSQLINFRSSFAKETRNYERTPSIEKGYSQLEKSELMKFQEYEKSVLELKLAIGQNLIPVATQLMGVMKPVSEIFRDHPTLAKYAMTLMLIGKAGGGVLETFSIFNHAGHGVDNFFSRMVYGSDAAGGAMSRAERQALGLSRGLRGLPTSLTIGLTLGAAWFTLQQILNLLDAREKADAAEKEAKVAGAQTATSIDKLESSYRMSGQKVPRDVYKQQAAHLFSAIDLEGTLKNSLSGNLTLGTSFQQAYDTLTFGGRDFSPFMSNGAGSGLFNQIEPLRMMRQRQLLQDRAPELRSPGLMKEFLSSFRGRMDITPEGKGYFEKILAQAFPTAFKQASAELYKPVASALDQYTKLGFGLNPSSQLGQLLLGIEPPAKSATDALSLLAPAAEKLPGFFDRVGSAAERLGARLDAVQLNSPTTEGDGFGTGTKRTTIFSVLGLPGMLAKGGRARKGRSYIVGERGMELFSPNEDGYVTPNYDLFGQSGDALRASITDNTSRHYNITLNVNGDVKEPERLAAAFVEQLAARLEEVEKTTKDRRHFDRMYGRSSRNERQRT
jgi:hypothetical protein